MITYSKSTIKNTKKNLKYVVVVSLLSTYFTFFSSILIVDFEQVIFFAGMSCSFICTEVAIGGVL